MTVEAKHRALMDAAIEELLADAPFMADRDQQEELARAAVRRGWNLAIEDIKRELKR